jgi:hypothetical protein
MRESALRYAALDRFGYGPRHAGSSVAPVVETHLDTRSIFDVRESERADELEHLWIELGGEG